MPSLLLDDSHPVPATTNPLGVKGVGEAGIVNPAPAIANAVYDAIGLRIHSLPIAPDKVLYALRHRGERNWPGVCRVSGQYA